MTGDGPRGGRGSARFFVLARSPDLKHGRIRIGALLAVIVLAAIAYTGYSANAVYQGLDHGREQLVSAQTSMNAAGRSGDAAQLRSAAAQLEQAERDFTHAQQRSRTDPGLRLVSVIPPSGRQLDASAHLGAIGADLSRAGEGAASVALQVAALRQQYTGRRLTPDDLQALLGRAQAISRNYSGSIQAIGRQLNAAHAERAEVNTTGLLPPLQHAYDEVDRALSEADTAFLRYQDVRQVLSDFLGVRLPG